MLLINQEEYALKKNKHSFFKKKLFFKDREKTNEDGNTKDNHHK